MPKVSYFESWKEGREGGGGETRGGREENLKTFLELVQREDPASLLQ